MRYGSLHQVDNQVSRLVMGSMDLSTEKQGFVDDVLDEFVDRGGTAIDTARVYARGTSEEAIGNWLHSRGCRDRVVVIAKCGHRGGQTAERRVEIAAIHEDIESSLRVMRLDRIDVYLLHKDDPNAPVGPIVEALNEERSAGRIGAFGGSNWPHQRIAEANAYAEAHGIQPFSVSSPNLSLAVPNEPMWVGCVSLAGDREALEWYEKTQLAVFAWSSQARGFFSGRFTPARPEGPEGTTPAEADVIRTYFSDANWERYRRAEELSKAKGCTRTQLVLAWVLALPLDVYAVIGPASMSELGDSLGAVDVPLSQDEVDWLACGDERS